MSESDKKALGACNTYNHSFESECKYCEGKYKYLQLQNEQLIKILSNYDLATPRLIQIDKGAENADLRQQVEKLTENNAKLQANCEYYKDLAKTNIDAYFAEHDKNVQLLNVVKASKFLEDEAYRLYLVNEEDGIELPHLKQAIDQTRDALRKWERK